jgi:hypothetical protein
MTRATHSPCSKDPPTSRASGREVGHVPPKNNDLRKTVSPIPCQTDFFQLPTGYHNYSAVIWPRLSENRARHQEHKSEAIDPSLTPTVHGSSQDSVDLCETPTSSRSITRSPRRRAARKKARPLLLVHWFFRRGIHAQKVRAESHSAAAIAPGPVVHLIFGLVITSVKALQTWHLNNHFVIRTSPSRLSPGVTNSTRIGTPHLEHVGGYGVDPVWPGIETLISGGGVWNNAASDAARKEP